MYTLTGHFISYTLLVKGWTPFAFRTALILRGVLSTQRSSESFVLHDMLTSRRCSSMMRIPCCTTTVTFSRPVWDIIWCELWWTLLLAAAIRRWFMAVIKGWTWSSTILRFKRDHLVLTGTKYAMKISSTPLHSNSLNHWWKPGWSRLSGC